MRSRSACGVIFITCALTNKKPTVLERKLSVSRVFPVDDSAKVESPKVCLSRCLTDAIKIILAGDLNHIMRLCNLLRDC